MFLSILQNGTVLLTCLIDLLGLLQNESRTRSTLFYLTKTYGYLPVSDTKVPVSFKVIFDWWMDFDVRGSTFHSVRTRPCTHMTDLNSVNQSMHCTLYLGDHIFTYVVSVKSLSSTIAL
ncbi:UNVERIFIED_CONTAM: hypothetical protein NCL1_41243 [Trichonephila clavipes]